ncbi:hypothetical protein ACH4SK_38800 [Streptomyces inhibens]|uniref:hypothetical protein n=1 Tax=Streptomyces inhibens TaxID=2293571 RepID=UPI0037A02263
MHEPKHAQAKTVTLAQPLIRAPLPPDAEAIARLLRMILPDGPNVDQFAMQLATLPTPAPRRVVPV